MLGASVARLDPFGESGVAGRLPLRLTPPTFTATPSAIAAAPNGMWPRLLICALLAVPDAAVSHAYTLPADLLYQFMHFGCVVALAQQTHNDRVV